MRLDFTLLEGRREEEEEKKKKKGKELKLKTYLPCSYGERATTFTPYIHDSDLLLQP